MSLKGHLIVYNSSMQRRLSSGYKKIGHVYTPTISPRFTLLFVDLSIYMLCIFLINLLYAGCFQNHCFRNFSNTITMSNSLDADQILSSLAWVQTACKDYMYKQVTLKNLWLK